MTQHCPVARRTRCLAIAVLGAIVPVSSSAQSNRVLGEQASEIRPPWRSLTAGRYDVGFRFVPHSDASRRVGPPVDFEGRPAVGSLALPTPFAVWYPARSTPNATHMQYGTFAALGVKRTDMTPVTAVQRRAAIERMRAFAGFAFGREISEEAMRAVDTTSTAAISNATPADGRFPVVLAATDGSIAAATVLFEYLASHGIVVFAMPSAMSYATLQVGKPNAVVEARVRDLELLLDESRHFTFVDTTRIAVLGVNFDGMAALSFQMKNMAARAVVSLDGWEGKQNGAATIASGLHYDPRRMRVPYLVVLQDENGTPPALRLDRTLFDAFRYASRQWLVLPRMTHAYLIGNPLVYPGVPDDQRASYERIVRGIHGFLDDALHPAPETPRAIVTDGAATDSNLVRTFVMVAASSAVPDDAELERLIMVERDIDKVRDILRRSRRSDSTFAPFSEETISLYAFRFSRQGDIPFATRLLELNAEAFPGSWRAAMALGDRYRDLGDSARAVETYRRALENVGRQRTTRP